MIDNAALASRISGDGANGELGAAKGAAIANGSNSLSSSGFASDIAGSDVRDICTACARTTGGNQRARGAVGAMPRNGKPRRASAYGSFVSAVASRSLMHQVSAANWRAMMSRYIERFRLGSRRMSASDQ
ncbi:MAG: hypothetical protein KA144_05605 [Xanthomonadaceae bacterium]|nr:hypothetical protein [Xanthomonadaceae bacterium]